MVNYNLEEFKAWLEADESRKAGLTNLENVLQSQVITDIHLKKLVDQENYQGQKFAHGSWNPYRQAALKWISEVDQRERESKFRRRNYA